MAMNKKYLFLILPILFIPFSIAEAQYGSGCEQYGSMAYLSGGYCKCLSGYVFDTSLTGSKYCTSASSVCYNKYGYGSQYDSLSDSCECSYGYVFGKDSLGQTSCITESQACENQFGYHARSTYGGKCECSYGYVFSGGQCVDGDSVCHDKHGYHSSYDDSSNSCECDSGYTLNDSNQCVEKQNNVYFKLLDVDTDNRQAIIKSEYDSSKYLITYSYGCYASSINRYVNHDLVVNLGTDFYLDTYDTIVLQDDDETCDITRKERTYDDSLVPPEDTTTYYVPPSVTVKPTYTPPAQITAPVAPVKDSPVVQSVSEWKASLQPKATSTVSTGTSTQTFATDSTPPQKPIWRKILDWFKWW